VDFVINIIFYLQKITNLKAYFLLEVGIKTEQISRTGEEKSLILDLCSELQFSRREAGERGRQSYLYECNLVQANKPKNLSLVSRDFFCHPGLCSASKLLASEVSRGKYYAGT
jgi:hypothetical protein